MKTFKQFSEGLLGKKGDGYLGPKFLGIKNPVAAGKESKPKYENPGDGSIPGRYKDESIIDYKKRRNKEIQRQINSI